jgi:hypothetical protein
MNQGPLAGFAATSSFSPVTVNRGLSGHPLSNSFSLFIQSFRKAMNSQVAIFTTALLLGTSGIGLSAQVSRAVEAPIYLTQWSNPVTYTTLLGNGDIAIQITDGGYRVHTTLMSDENGYIGVDGISRIYLNPLTGQVIVTSTETGEEFYNYYIPPLNTHPNISTYGHVATPVTSITQQNPNQLYAEITEGEFRFSGVLNRTDPSVNSFIGSDNQVRVWYDRDAGRIVIINLHTGDEYYNYSYSPGSRFAD